MPTRLPPRRADGRFKRDKRRRRNPFVTEAFVAFAKPAAAAAAAEFAKDVYQGSKKRIRKGKKRR